MHVDKLKLKLLCDQLSAESGSSPRGSMSVNTHLELLPSLAGRGPSYTVTRAYQVEAILLVIFLRGGFSKVSVLFIDTVISDFNRLVLRFVIVLVHLYECNRSPRRVNPFFKVEQFVSSMTEFKV